MILGGILLPEAYTPLECTKPRAMRTTAVVSTYGGVAVFDWGSILAGKEIKPESAAAGSPVPLHPGAIRYYREKGLIR